MAQTPTTLIPLGFEAPAFSLPDTVSGKVKSLDELKSEKATVIMFICNHCPFVVHVIDELVRLANDYIPKGVSFVAISSNDVVKYPQDGPEMMNVFATTNKFPFPYLYDETQDVARAYSAACTPDFSIFNGDLKCVYRGQLDDSRPSNGKPVTGKDIREALDVILEGKPVSADQKVSIGCNIKWK
ncbi:MAG: thioredoxin family protein [Bacteroidia bacterium]